MSLPIQRPLAGTFTGLALPVALNTPPSSIGRQTSSAPVSATSPGSWVHARYDVGLPKSKKYSSRFRSVIVASPGFGPGPQIELVGPGGSRLAMEVPVVLGDGVGVEDAVLALGRVALGEVLGDEGRVDRAVDDDVGDMDALGPELA